MGAEDIVGTLVGEYLDPQCVLPYLKAVSVALTTGRSHCSYRIENTRLFAVMEGISSMRVRVTEWVIYCQEDLEMIIGEVLIRL